MAEEKLVNLEKTGEIELPSIDVTKHIGKKAKIVRVTEQEGIHGYFVKLETEILEVITGGKEPINISASRIFGLQEDDKGNIGWGADTKLGLFLKKMKVNHYKDLEGVEVIVQSTTNKDGKDYLSFN